jgi:hypothetical protein
MFLRRQASRAICFGREDERTEAVRRAMRIVGMHVQAGAGIVLTLADAVGE